MCAHTCTRTHTLICSTCFRFITLSTELEYQKLHSDSDICFALFSNNESSLHYFLPNCYNIIDVIYDITFLQTLVIQKKVLFLFFSNKTEHTYLISTLPNMQCQPKELKCFSQHPDLNISISKIQ